MKDVINAQRAGILELEKNLLSLKSNIQTADITTRPDVPTGATPDLRRRAPTSCG